jgi:membrane-bound lytic murein transglycosylase B
VSPAAVALPLVLPLMLLAGCAGESRPSFTERGYPQAPEQELPAAASTATDVAITDLVEPVWLAVTAERTGIPQRAVAAYAGAALRLAETMPDCGIGWNTIAGIAQVESVHGAIFGGGIGDDGVVSPPIVGIPLDGTEGTMAVVDTDGGALDGDAEWDRAVGPLQFIPETWQRVGQDANLDGVADPHNIDDAALTAGVYLCESGGELVSDDGWNAAVSTYNVPTAYAHRVAGYARDYFAG